MSGVGRINNYANSMFRYEVLHETWVSACGRYLDYVFGDDAICGQTVVDYAFGRGNWAIAFARRGAGRVIAIDAAEDNCRKLQVYCKENKITNVEVICGNLVERDMVIECDIFWLYGILHHIEAQDDFLGRLVSKVKPDGEVLAYTYNANSLREWLVSAARACVVFENEDDFRAHSLWFTPSARMRARDDLVAPHINWDNAATFVDRFRRLGWHAARQLPDFAPWLHGSHSGEFYPYVVKFARQGAAVTVASQEDSLGDLAILRSLSELITQRLPLSWRLSFAIGLFNTHFQSSLSAMGAGLMYKTNEQVAWEDFKYLVYAAKVLSVCEQDFVPDMAEVWNAAMCSLQGSPREIQGNLPSGSSILKLLSETSMRL